MESVFWHNLWENNLTGFHLDDVNPLLRENWSVLNLPAGSRVFVPLCGKSLDLIWLAEEGYQVVAVELSALAAEAFFSENRLNVERQQVGNLELWQSDKIGLFCVDFFDLTAEILGHVDAFFDRASLISFPPAIRPDYAAQMAELTQSAPKLLVTLEYDQSRMDGPPFSVSEGEVRALYQSKYQVKQLTAQDVLGDNVKFREKVLDFMNECIYQLSPKS